MTWREDFKRMQEAVNPLGLPEDERGLMSPTEERLEAENGALRLFAESLIECKLFPGEIEGRMSQQEIDDETDRLWAEAKKKAGR